jgi:hypothetical protein
VRRSSVLFRWHDPLGRSFPKARPGHRKIPAIWRPEAGQDLASGPLYLDRRYHAVHARFCHARHPGLRKLVGLRIPSFDPLRLRSSGNLAEEQAKIIAQQSHGDGEGRRQGDDISLKQSVHVSNLTCNVVENKKLQRSWRPGVQAETCHCKR